MISVFGLFLVLAFAGAYIAFGSEYARRGIGVPDSPDSAAPGTSPGSKEIPGSSPPGGPSSPGSAPPGGSPGSRGSAPPGGPGSPGSAPPAGSRGLSLLPSPVVQLMDEQLLYCGLAGFAGALLFAAVEDPRHIGFHGLNFYGALLAGTATWLYINRRHGISPATAADIGSPGMMLAYSIGRLGCHLAGDGDWGIVNAHTRPRWLGWLPDWAWAWRYPHNVIRQGVYIPGCSGGYCTQLAQPVYPTPLYESVLCLLLFGLLWAVRRRIERPGTLFALYAVLNGLERFFIETIRITPRYELGGWQLSQAQLIALAWVIAGLAVAARPRKKWAVPLIAFLPVSSNAQAEHSARTALPGVDRDTVIIRHDTTLTRHDTALTRRDTVITCRDTVIIRRDTTLTRWFDRDTGWIASDGCISIPLSDHRVLWMMGDSYIDNYNKARRTTGCLFQVRNSALLQPRGDWDPRATKTLIGRGPGIPSYLKNDVRDDHLLWPTGGYQHGDTVYVYANNIVNASGGLGFASGGSDFLVRLLLPGLTVAGYDSLPFFNGATFGLGFDSEEPGDYVYTWGIRSGYIESRIVVARMRRDNPRAPWCFWNGNAWDTAVAHMADVAAGASNGTYVGKVGRRYVLVSTAFSVACDQGRHIYIATSDRITGPFSGRRILYTIPDEFHGHTPFFYGPAIHPEYINANNELLITYDINGYNPCEPDCVNGEFDPDHYRPRGIRVPLALINSDK